MNRIEEALRKNFEKHRIILWYDEKEELLDQFNEVSIDGVHSLYIQGNEFEVKHRIYFDDNNSKFLLYFTGDKPANEENWLLDIELANYVFYTDQEAMFLQELGLEYHFKELVSEHIEFFKSKERRAKLKELLGEGDEYYDIQYKMLAVLFGTDNISLITFIHAHGSAYSDGNEKFDKELERFNLLTFYWKEIGRKYNYQSDDPSIYDFLLEVFNNNFELGKKTGISRESRLLISLWQNTYPYRDSFSKVSELIGKDIGIEQLIAKATIEDIVTDYEFELTDQRVIHELVTQIIADEISFDRVNKFIKERQNKFWYLEYENLYNALKSASEFLQLANNYKSVKYSSFDQGAEDYAKNQYRVDQLYRKYIRYFRKASQNRILADLTQKVEKVYTNEWLLSYSNNWQTVIDGLTEWKTPYTKSQKNFFKTYVHPTIDKGQRLFVIITDALRYECGQELTHKLQQENRYDSELDYMVTVLPSFTQLGMASLLPNSELKFQEGSYNVIVDSIPSFGSANREKILTKNSGVKSAVIDAEDFMKLNSATEGREFVKLHDLIYIYHNRIDKLGDDVNSEEKVFDAVEEEVFFLIDLLKKITNMNGNNMIITSDHGFLYQNEPLDESDFIESKVKGDVWKDSRRFVIGKDLKGDNSLKHFTGSQLGLNSDVDVLIPKSINRLRTRGSGSRYTHGGATLQEIVVPMISVTKKRKDTTTKVDVDIIKTTDKITTNILAVSFIQSELVKDNVLPRSLKAALYADDETLLSDQFQYLFDIEEGSERQREVKHRFQLSSQASGQYKNQRVKLVLQEPIEGSSKWKTYKEFIYTLNISFTSDFDDF